MGIPFLSAERLYLRPLEPTDADGPYVAWFNDEMVCRGNSHHVWPYTRDNALAYIEASRRATDRLVLAIVLREGDRHIGNIALQCVHPLYRSAEFAIVLGDRTAWGNGYSKEAGRLICHHGFNALNVHRVYCGTFEENHAMRRLAAYLGMKEEGRRREAAFKDGRYVDLIEYGVLDHEFRQLPPAEVRHTTRTDGPSLPEV